MRCTIANRSCKNSNRWLLTHHQNTIQHDNRRSRNKEHKRLIQKMTRQIGLWNWNWFCIVSDTQVMWHHSQRKWKLSFHSRAYIEVVCARKLLRRSFVRGKWRRSGCFDCFSDAILCLPLLSVVRLLYSLMRVERTLAHAAVGRTLGRCPGSHA